MGRVHTYRVDLDWTSPAGTTGFVGYDRDHIVSARGREMILGSSDPAFRGSRDRWNPEQLLVASIAQCHMLWYLHLACWSGVVVTAYHDVPMGTMRENDDGSGQFEQVVLRPTVTVTHESMVDAALAAHWRVSEMCFITRSLNFPVHHEPTVLVR